MGLINSNVKGDKVEIGRIDLMKSFAFVEVKNEDADRVIKSMKHGVTIKGRSVVVDRSEPAPKGQGARDKRKASPNPSERKPSPNPSKGGENRGKEQGARSKRKDAPSGTKKFEKADWMQFLHPEEGWARRRPKKK
jgi:ATP-dependent RNA helicase DeaD